MSFWLDTNFSPYYMGIEQTLALAIEKLNQMLRDPEAFQKVCIVARSIIQGFNFCCHTQHLSKLVEVLKVTESFDFYGFCRLPHYFLHPYSAERIDENDLLDQLAVILCQQSQQRFLDEQGQSSQMRNFAQQQLTAFLEQMAKNNQALHSANEVKTLLSHWLVQALKAHPHVDFSPHEIDMTSLVVHLKPATWLEKLTDATFVVIDIACVPAFLQDWSLIDLSFLAQRLGNLPLLAGLVKRGLDDCIWGTMGLGYGLQFLSACRNWSQNGLTLEESREAKWQMVASAAELLYCSVVFRKSDPRLIVSLAFCAKLVGLLRFLFAPRPPFFTAPAA